MPLDDFIGELFRKNLGGKWDIDLEDSNNAFLNIPTIHIPKAGAQCPSTLVTACVDRRKGDYIEIIYNIKKRRVFS
jgi:hypothetical protein